MPNGFLPKWLKFDLLDKINESQFFVFSLLHFSISLLLSQLSKTHHQLCLETINVKEIYKK